MAGIDVIALEWVQGSTPWPLVILLLATLGVVLGVAWIERPRDEWDDLARRDRRLGR